MKTLPYGRQSITDADINAVIDVMKGDWLTTGPMVGKFEDRLKETLGADHAVCCSSGTAGLHLAMLALGIGPGDQVIVPGITFVATANAVRLVGADVIFADVDPDTGLMTAQTFSDAVETATSPDTIRAVIVVHLNGQSVDVTEIEAFAASKNIKIVEDACHAIGGQQMVDGHPVPIGACKASDMAVFSFHPVKTITTAEGGAVTTNDPALAKKLRLFRSHGITRDGDDFDDQAQNNTPWYYEQHVLGLNYRLNDLQCALGLSQLDRLSEFVDERQILLENYRERLADIPDIFKIVTSSSICQTAWHLCAALVNFDKLSDDRGSFMQKLSSRGISTQVHYIPVYIQPYYKKLYGQIELAGCAEYYKRQLSLPLFPEMTGDDVDYVVEAIKEIINCE